MKLRSRFLVVASVLYILVGLGTLYMFHSIAGEVISSFAERFAAKEALIQKNRLLRMIDREIALSSRMADDDLVRRWVLNENNEQMRKAAFRQIEGYRKLAHDRESFLTIASSRNYYTFQGGAPTIATLQPEVPAHRWFFYSIENVDHFGLNTDSDPIVHRTKIWINTIMYDALKRKIAVVGSGVSIGIILDELIGNQEPGVSVYLVDEKGIIQASEDHDVVLHNAEALDADKITIYSLFNENGFGSQLRSAIEMLREEALQKSPRVSEDRQRRYQGVVTFPVDRTRVAAVTDMTHLGWYSIVLLDVGRYILLQEFIPILLVFVFSLLLLTVLLGFLMHRLVLSPLERLTAATSEVAAGHYGIRLPVERADEIGRLTSSFNAMAGVIADYTGDLEKKVQIRTAELEKSQKEIEQSIQYASMIQSSILPDAGLFDSCFSEHFILHRPKLAVGGDFHYLRNIGPYAVVAVADCTGHGVPGAFMTMTAVSTLNHIVDASRHPDPAAILAELNRIWKNNLRFKEIDAGLDIAVCVIEKGKNSLQFAGAGLSIFQYLDGKIVEHKGDAPRIGYRRSSADFSYRVQTVPAQEGSSFYLTTDGILDEPGGKKGFGFGSQRFQAMLQEYGHLPMEEQLDIYKRILQEYRGQYRQRDDQTLLGFRL